MYQSGRVGDEAKKRKSPPKAGELASMLLPILIPCTQISPKKYSC